MNPELLNTESPAGPATPSGQGPSRVARYLIAGGVLAGAVAFGSLISPIGLADAQTDDPAAEADADGADDSAGTTDDGTSDEDSDSGLLGRDGFGPLHGLGLRGSFDDLAETLGMEPGDLLTALRDGSSINELAEAQGIDAATVEQQLLDDLGARLDEAVADGHLDRDQADEILAEAEGRIGELMDLTLDDLPARFGPGGGRHDGFGPGLGLGLGAGMGLDDLAESLGLTVGDITTGLAEGRSLAEIAAEAGVDSEELIETILTAAGEHLDEAVADGRLDADRAAEIEADLAERVPELIETTPGELMGQGLGGMFGGRGGHGGPGGHRGDHGWFGDDDTGSDGSGDEGETEESSLTF